MKITDIFKKEFIIEELQSTGKQEVLAELSFPFLQTPYDYNKETVVGILMNREKLGSTGIGDGIAIPHGKLDGLEQIILSFGRSSRGIDYNSMDGKPVHLFFLLMAPENSEGRHLKALAKISRMLKNGDFRKRLREAKTRDDLYNAIVEKDRAA